MVCGNEFGRQREESQPGESQKRGMANISEGTLQGFGNFIWCLLSYILTVHSIITCIICFFFSFPPLIVSFIGKSSHWWMYCFIICVSKNSTSTNDWIIFFVSFRRKIIFGLLYFLMFVKLYYLPCPCSVVATAKLINVPLLNITDNAFLNIILKLKFHTAWTVKSLPVLNIFL